MIVIRADLISSNGSERDKHFGTIKISNDGTGTEVEGNYDVYLCNANGRRTKHGRVEKFKRKAQGWIKLTAAAFKVISRDNKYSEEDLAKALDESLKLQRHYAELLNMHDGGRRKTYASVEDWMIRLKQTGVIKG